MERMNSLSAIVKALDMEAVYRTMGVFLFAFALLALADKRNPKRWSTALFIGLYGVTFAFGAVLPALVTGACVLVMGFVVVVFGVQASQPKLPSKERKMEDANRLGRWLFAPFLSSLLLTFLSHWAWDLDILVAFGGSNLIILVVLLPLMRESPLALARDGKRIFDTIGWTIILPQLLVALGSVFDAAGMGDILMELVDSFLQVEGRLTAVAVYCLATAFFSMMMGNAFPAFLVVSSGIGIPLVIRQFGADPAVAGIIALLSGFCGTLMTPMAMNFNMIPAQLLGIRSMGKVLKVQAEVAIPLLLVNIALMYFLAF